MSIALQLQVTYYFVTIRPPPRPTLFPYTTLFRSHGTTPIGRDPHPHATDAAPRSEGHNVLTGPALRASARGWKSTGRSEEHTSELQSHVNLVCRLLLEKKKKKISPHFSHKTNEH